MKRIVLLAVLAVFVAAQAGQEVELTAEPHHHLVLANDEVRVFSVEAPPHSETLMHWHRHDYIYVVIGNAEIVNAVKGQNPVPLHLLDGEVRFASANFAHVFQNLSAEPFRNVTVELLQDAKMRHVTEWRPGHPEEDRGLAVFSGGTEEILFVKDGVRASECELQPAGIIPRHHYLGPHLLVALTNVELRTAESANNTKATISLKPGESRWFRAGYSHALKNTGQQAAKFITLEFKQ